MSVRAKFKCTEVRHSSYEHGSQQHVVVLQPVTCGAGNESWAKHTPSGRLEMTITNPDALERFKPGAEYFLDFTPVAG